LNIVLKYKSGIPAINGLKRISKPGLRVYRPADKLPKVLNGLGTAVISTPKGLLTDKDARNQLIGGEVVCYIW
jgi:small subunit ribosomal protein S8